jgi:hypothetical protein
MVVHDSGVRGVIETLEHPPGRKPPQTSIDSEHPLFAVLVPGQ